MKESAVIKLHNVTQGTPEWYNLRKGILTASELKLILTPTLKIAANDKEKTHLFNLLAQRITDYIEPQFEGFNMARGKMEEVEAKLAYSKHYAQVQDVGFVTNDRWGFTLGCSPDGLVGDDGLIECKSRCQKYQLETILGKQMPEEFMLQVQTALLVTNRLWCDFISYCGGMHMLTIRVHPNPKVQDAILQAAREFYERMKERHTEYEEIIADPSIRLIPTERKEYNAEPKEGVYE